MRGDLNWIIIIVVGVVLGGAVLVLGFRGVGEVEKGIGGFTSVGKSMMESVNPRQIDDVCSQWVNSGSRMFDPETIRDLGVVDAFLPYRRFKEECGGPLNELVVACQSNPDECPNGVLDSDARVRSREYGAVQGSDKVSCCIKACDTARSLYNQCQMSKNTDAEVADCFNTLMNEEYFRC